MSNKMISPVCVYTIVHTTKLNEVYKKGGTGTFTENKNWATANRLLKTCQQTDMQMLVIFAPAENTYRLTYYATLNEITIEKSENKKVATTFRVSNLTPFDKSSPLKTSVIVKSTGRPIPEGHIRPYVICETPKKLVDRKQ